MERGISLLEMQSSEKIEEGVAVREALTQTIHGLNENSTYCCLCVSHSMYLVNSLVERSSVRSHLGDK